jgi:hypothetical protein
MATHLDTIQTDYPAEPRPVNHHRKTPNKRGRIRNCLAQVKSVALLALVGFFAVSSYANSSIFVSVLNQQQHFAYRDINGNIWDSWYNGPSNSWNLQKINNGGNTSGTAASFGPFVSVFNQQQHFVYLDYLGTIWDSWYNGSNNSWNLQAINRTFAAHGNTAGPAAASDVFVSVFNQQQHFAYGDSHGKIWDAWYNGTNNSWNLQQINQGGNTSGPAAAFQGLGVFVSVFNQQQHFVYSDVNGNIWDAWYNGPRNNWNLQKINNGGNTIGPSSGGYLAPFVSVFNQQQHFAYRDLKGVVWDAWFNGPADSWNLQKINSGGNTAGPGASDCCDLDSSYFPFVSVFNEQQHFTYPDAYGNVWDAWYNGPANNWNLQKINAGGNTSGPATNASPFVSVFDQQQHFAYQDSSGIIWDCWFNGPVNRWEVNKINLGGNTNGPAAAPDGPSL